MHLQMMQASYRMALPMLLKALWAHHWLNHHVNKLATLSMTSDVEACEARDLFAATAELEDCDLLAAPAAEAPAIPCT